MLLVEPKAGYALAEAGLQPGDRLLRWRRAEGARESSRAEGAQESSPAEGARESSPAEGAPRSDPGGGAQQPAAGGAFTGVFELLRVASEEAPLGQVHLVVDRGGLERTLPVPAGHWLGEFMPVLAADNAPDASITAWRQLQAAPRTLQEARRLVQTLPLTGDARARQLQSAWCFHLLAGAARAAADTALEKALLQQAVAAAERAGDAFAAGWIVQYAGIAAFSAGRPADGVPLLEDALARWSAWDADSLAVSNSLNNLAIAANIRGDYAAAQRLAQRSLDIRRRRTGDSLLVARALHTLGNAAFWSDDLDGAEAHFRAALQIRQRLDPGGPSEAANLSVLANVHWRHGELARADELLMQALTIYRERLPDSPVLGDLLLNLGNVAHDRGDLQQAERHRLEALAHFEHAPPQGNQIASALLGLGNVAARRGDTEAARAYFERALARFEAMQPNGQRIAMVRSQLGRLALEAGDLDQAQAQFEASLATMRDLGGNGPLVANRLQSLGEVAAARSDWPLAREYYAQALAIFSRHSRRNLQVAAVLRDMAAMAASASGDLAAARGYLTEALGIAQELAPGTYHVAEAAFALAELPPDVQDADAAIGHCATAMAALDAQRGRLGGSDRARASFESRHATHYHHCLRVALSRGDVDGAFGILERYRARALRAVLSERSLDLRRQLPASLAKRAQQVNWRYQQAHAALLDLEGAGAGDPAARRQATDDARRDLAQARSEREQLEATIRATRPTLARALQPAPARAGELIGALPADTALLSYAVMTDMTVAFIVPPVGAGNAPRQVEAVTLPIRAEALSELVSRIRLLVRSPAAAPDLRAGLDGLLEQAHALLLAPLRERIAGANTLVVLADGPLHVLPFSALRNGASGRYLIEDLVVRFSPSAELGATSLQPSPPGAQARVEAFGTPPADSASPMVASYTRARFAPLPWVDAELAAIRRHYPKAVLHAGTQAREALARSLDPATDVVHFATHARIDRRHPLDSFLLLSPSSTDAPADDGLLQAWEIYEQVQLQASLVVLSACDTALGQQLGGEGLLGLTRAFHAAGAREVIATLWSVADRSTAALMETLYAQLAAGATPAEALRSAQLTLLRHRDFGAGAADTAKSAPSALTTTHPFHWAGFQLHGAIAD